MTWKVTVLLVALMGCKERPLDKPNPPPDPPGAELWPLGGKIYHGIKPPGKSDLSTDPEATTPQTDPPEEAPAEEAPTEEAPADGDPAEEAPAEEQPAEEPPEQEAPAIEETP